MSTTQYVNIEATLRQIEDKEIAIQYQDEAVFMNEIAASMDGLEVNQKGYQFTAEFTADPGGAYIGAGGSNPAGGSNKYQKMSVGYVRYRKTIELDNDTWHDMNMGKENAFLQFSDKLARVNAAGMREMEEAAMGDGKGRKAIVGAGSTTTSIVLTNTPTTTPFSSKGADFLIEDGVYALYDSSDALREANIRLSAIAKGTSPTATPAATLSVTPASTDYLVIYDAGSGSSINKVHRGIRYLINNDTGLFQGLLRSSRQELKSPMEDLAGKPFQPPVWMRLQSKIKYRRGVKAGQGLSCLTSLSMDEANRRTGLGFFQISPGQTWDGVIQKGQVGDAKLVQTTTLDDDCMFFFERSDLKKIENQKWGFVRDATNQTFKQKQGNNGTGADGVYANLGANVNFYLKNPSRHGGIIRGSLTDLGTSQNAWS